MQSVTLLVFTTILVLTLAKSVHEIFDESSEHTSEDYSNKYSYNANKCIDELNLRDANGGINTESSNYKCYLRCLYHKYEFIDDEGEPNLEYFSAHMRPIVSTCNDKSKSKETCERISSFITCYKREIQLYYEKLIDECENETNSTFSTKKLDVTSSDCMGLCILKKLGMVTKYNEINVDSFTEMAKNLQDFDITKVIQRCKKENICQSKCAKMVKTSNCVTNAIYGDKSAESDEWRDLND